MIAVPAAPAGNAPGPQSELQIMQAIVQNCTALGMEPEAARRMAVRSIMSLRRARALA